MEWNSYLWGFGSGFVVALVIWAWWYHGNMKPLLDEYKRKIAEKIHGGG
jgi:hypothetical protein